MKALLVIAALIGVILLAIPFFVDAPGQLEVRCQDKTFARELKGLKAEFVLADGGMLTRSLQGKGKCGTARLGPLEPRQVTVEVRVPGYKPAKATARIEPLKLSVVELQLEPMFGGLTVSAAKARKRGKVYIDSPLTVQAKDQAATGDPKGVLLIPLPPGRHEVTLKARGYCPTTIKANVEAGKVIRALGFMSPTLTGKELATLVLRWGPQPQDLDLHLFLPFDSGLSNNHIYFPAKHMRALTRRKRLVATLDVDNRFAEGPETITLFQGLNGKYLVGVYHFKGLENIARSNGYLTVYTRDCKTYVFRAPTSCDRRWWHVCNLEVKGGKITVTPVGQCHPKSWRIGCISSAYN